MSISPTKHTIIGYNQDANIIENGRFANNAHTRMASMARYGYWDVVPIGNPGPTAYAIRQRGYSGTSYYRVDFRWNTMHQYTLQPGHTYKFSLWRFWYNWYMTTGTMDNFYIQYTDGSTNVVAGETTGTIEDAEYIDGVGVWYKCYTYVTLPNGLNVDDGVKWYVGYDSMNYYYNGSSSRMTYMADIKCELMTGDMTFHSFNRDVDDFNGSEPKIGVFPMDEIGNKAAGSATIPKVITHLRYANAGAMASD